VLVGSLCSGSFIRHTNSPVSTGMCDCLQAGILPRYVTKPTRSTVPDMTYNVFGGTLNPAQSNPTRSTQPCIPSGLLNRVPALIGWIKGGNVTAAGWQVTLWIPCCMWIPIVATGEACCELLYIYCCMLVVLLQSYKRAECWWAACGTDSFWLAPLQPRHVRHCSQQSNVG